MTIELPIIIPLIGNLYCALNGTTLNTNHIDTEVSKAVKISIREMEKAEGSHLPLLEELDEAGSPLLIVFFR